MAAARNVSEREARAVVESAREREWNRPSFGKELFLGRLRLDLIHPHPRPSKQDRRDGEEFLNRLRAFLENKVDAAQIERDARIPTEVIDGLKEIGAFGMTIPPRYGGLGLSHLYYVRALQLAASCSPAMSTLLSAHQSIGVPEPLMLFGTEEQKARYLPLVARSEISAFLLTEPDVGSDPARLATSATPTDDGTAYVLNGTKLWTTNGVIADRLIVMARVPKGAGLDGDGRGGISAFIVDAHAPGVEVLHRNQFMGLRGIENGVTRFTDVRVPREDVLGREGQGLRIALTTLNTGRLSLPAICSAGAKWGLGVAREWSGARVQWGRPIGEHEAVGAKLALLAQQAFALEAIGELTASLADDGRNDIRLEAAMAKLYSSEWAWTALDDVVQIRGGRGFETADSLRARGERGVPAEQALRDMRITRIFEGSSEIMRLFIAREAVDQHLAVAGGLIEQGTPVAARAKAGARAGRFYARWLPTLVVGEGVRPSGFADFGELAPHVRYIERAARRLARATFYGMARWQGGLERRQGFLGRIVDIGCELYAMSAVVVRAKMMADDDSSQTALARELAAAFCAAARLRVEELFHRLWHNSDDTDRALAGEVLAGRYRWLEEGIVDPSGGGPLVAEP